MSEIEADLIQVVAASAKLLEQTANTVIANADCMDTVEAMMNEGRKLNKDITIMNLEFLIFINFILINNIKVTTVIFQQLLTEVEIGNMKAVFTAYLDLKEKMKIAGDASSPASLVQQWLDNENKEEENCKWAEQYRTKHNAVIGDIADPKWFTILKQKCTPIVKKFKPLLTAILDIKYPVTLQDENKKQNEKVRYNYTFNNTCTYKKTSQ
jgi:hypothetical protein